MKHFLISLTSFLVTGLFVNAQKNFKQSLSGITRIEIETDANLYVVKGTTKEISISNGCPTCGTQNEENDNEDKRAKGLQAIYSGGTDNTGMGVLMKQEGSVLKLKDLKGYIKRSEMTVTLPGDVALVVNSSHTGNVSVDGWNAELEINTVVGSIDLKNVTGPVTAYSSTGKIEVNFSNLSQSAPSTITSSTGIIDVTLAAATKASVEMKSVTGGVYSNFDLVKPREDGLKPLNGNRAIAGDINNGGVKLSLKASTGNIYLRKK